MAGPRGRRLIQTEASLQGAVEDAEELSTKREARLNSR